MKHSLLILFSLLLLSSPVIGKETVILYYWERSSGDLWKPCGDDNTNPKYEGDIKNGKPDGLGIIYKGSLVRGKMENLTVKEELFIVIVIVIVIVIRWVIGRTEKNGTP